MTIKELVQEFSKYDPETRVFISDHGADEDMEIIGCYESSIYDEDDNEIGQKLVLYEY